MIATKVLKDLSVVLELSIPPSNVPISYTFQLKKGQLLLDLVKSFMVLHDIPCYLEVSVMSIVESLMRESWRRDLERDAKRNK